MNFEPGEPKTLEDMLRITASADRICVRKRPRMNPVEAWKDPSSCCERMGIIWEEAIERIIMPLRAEDFVKGPEESLTSKVPEKKWTFKVYTPPGIVPRRRLYIRLSSKHSNDLYVESFHKTEKPDDYIDIDEEIDCL